MAFDGIACKAITSELQPLIGARIDKIFEPNKNNIIIGMYLDGKNYLLNLSIDPQNYRINLSTHTKKNPKSALNFCMLLRKYLLGLRLKSISTIDLERVVFIEFEGFNDIDDLISFKLIVELMGKHSNIILVDDSKIIVDSLRHTKNIDDGHRNIIPHTKYVFPTTNKLSFLEIKNFTGFKSIISDSSEIYNKFNGISKATINSIIESTNSNSLENIYNYLCLLIENIGTYNLEFKNFNNDYSLINSKNIEPFCLNFFIDDFYYKKETSQEFKIYRDSILKLILSILKKYNKRLLNIDAKLKECENMDIYKLYGELITANLYRIKNENVSFIELENYYDNNTLIKIPLDSKYLPSLNAKRFFKKYNKLKNALEIVSKQKNETLKELDYIESIVYELESSSTIEEVSNIYDEISENVIFNEKTRKYQNTKKSKLKKSKLTKNKQVSFNSIKYTVSGFTIFVGRNNKENDFLTLKYASKSDIWFHTKTIHGSHVILRNLNNQNITEEILIKCAQIAAFYSKGKNSSNVPVDYCMVKFVKKPAGSKPGMVIYTHNNTLYVDPKV